MAVRRQCNRYRTEPSGRDYKAVLKKGKAFFTYNGYHQPFEMSNYDGLWLAHRRTLPGFAVHEGTILIEWNREKNKWEEKEA